MTPNAFRSRRYLTEDADHLLRSANQTIGVVRTLIADNRREAVHALSPFRERMDNDRIGEVTFAFNHSVIARNGRGIEQFSRWVLGRKGLGSSSEGLTASGLNLVEEGVTNSEFFAERRVKDKRGIRSGCPSRTPDSCSLQMIISERLINSTRKSLA